MVSTQGVRRLSCAPPLPPGEVSFPFIAGIGFFCVGRRRYASQAGELRAVAWSIYAVLSFLPQTGCCTLFWASEAICLGWSPYMWRGLLGCRNLSSFPAPSQWGRSHPLSLSSYPVTWRSFLHLWASWDILPEFSRFSMRIFPCIGVFFYVFVGGGELYIFYSAILIPPCDYGKVVSIIYLYLIFTFLYSFISFWKNSCLLFKKTLSHSSALFIPLFTQSWVLFFIYFSYVIFSFDFNTSISYCW